MGNTINHNNMGIYLSSSNYNIVSGNILKGSNYNNFPDGCIYEINCIGNIFSDNGPCTNGQEDAILGYNLFFLLGILSVVAIILSIKFRKL
jgi:parallel beta-helix repeat protein